MKSRHSCVMLHQAPQVNASAEQPPQVLNIVNQPEQVQITCISPHTHSHPQRKGTRLVVDDDGDDDDIPEEIHVASRPAWHSIPAGKGSFITELGSDLFLFNLFQIFIQ